MHREQVLWMARVRLDLLPHPGDVDVDGARRRHRVVAPDFVQQLVPGERRAAMLGEVFQEQELPGGEVERLAVAGDLGLAEVDADGTEPVRGCAGRRRGTAP